MVLNSIYKVSEWTQIVLLLLMYFVHYSHRYNSYFLYLITPQLKKIKTHLLGELLIWWVSVSVKFICRVSLLLVCAN